MKRNLLVLLAAVLVTSAAHAKTYTDRTFMNVRSTSVNPAMQLASWHDHKQDDDKCGTSIQAVGFYQQSLNAKKLANYFSSTGLTSPFTGVLKDFIGTDNVAASDKQYIHSKRFPYCGCNR